MDTTCYTITHEESVQNASPCGDENGSTGLTDIMNNLASIDNDDAICMRTRARYSLANCTLDELETFLQETDDEDDIQNVDDEKEYRKFLAAVLLGQDDSNNIQVSGNVDDEDEENDADFELELEEALESDNDEVEERRKSRRNRCKKSSLECGNNLSRPLCPLLPKGYLNHISPNIASPYMHPPVNNVSTSAFTPHQIGQLHCMIHEHVQLLIQVFSVSVLEPAKGQVAAETKELILEMLQQSDQVKSCGKYPYPRFNFFPPYTHSSVPNEQAASYQGQWAPYICGPVSSVIDVAPLRLVGDYLDDVLSAVRDFERCQIELGFESVTEKEPLFPVPDCQFSADTPSDCDGNQISKKTMAATLVEKAKNQSVALVPKEIAKLAQRFYPLFNPALYPHKPPPSYLTSRVLFSCAEDELLALGLMEYNNDWKAIQQRFLPCKSEHQIFVRQKNCASAKAPENPIKAVRRMKNSPLTSEEMTRIEVGLKKFKLDWNSIWRSFVPYRDPSLLPRQWRIANGTQKSYKSDPAKKAKRNLYELRRKKVTPSDSNFLSSSEKECDVNEPIEETNDGDCHMNQEDEPYVHEAFLEDSREANDNSLPGDIQRQILTNSPAALSLPKSPVVLRPYRSRRSNSRLVKLAPDLPPVNLPPSVRIMSRSNFNSSQGGINPRVETTAINQQPKYPKTLIGKYVAKEKVDSDLQMHPLLFRAPAERIAPYCPMDCSPSTSGSFTFFSGRQPQMNLRRDAVNFLSNSSKTPKKSSSSFAVDFHPLLQRTDDVHTDAISVTRQNCALISNPSAPDGDLSDSSAIAGSPRRHFSELDLNITPNNQEVVVRRNKGRRGTDISVRSPVSRVKESENAKDSDKGRYSRMPDDSSLPGIIMEHEELSDSEEEEFGENVEFECEEMEDSEGETTSKSEQEVQANGNAGDIGGNKCVSSTGFDIEKGELVNMKRGVFSLNLNSRPPISPISNPIDIVDLGGKEVPVSSKRRHVKAVHPPTKKHCRDLSLDGGDTLPRRTRKRGSVSTSNSSIAESGK